jgi:hypothetical protein
VNVFGDVSLEAAHAVAEDEGHHIVFETGEIVGHEGIQGCELNRKHRSEES